MIQLFTFQQVYHKPSVLMFLLSKGNCDPIIRNRMGETLVELLMTCTNIWHDSECVDIIKALLGTRQWEPDLSCNPKGETALHLSAVCHRPMVAHFH